MKVLSEFSMNFIELELFIILRRIHSILQRNKTLVIKMTGSEMSRY